MTISRSNISKQVTTGGRKMKKKGYRAGGQIKPRKMMAKGMRMGGKVMTLSAIRTAAKKKGYKLVKA